VRRRMRVRRRMCEEDVRGEEDACEEEELNLSKALWI